MNDYTRLIFADHGFRIPDTPADPKPGKRSYEDAFREETETEQAFSMRNVRTALKKDMVKSLKIRDRFVNTAFTKRDETAIDEWMGRVVASKERDEDVVDVYARAKISLPTEETINSYNMLINRPYEYSEFTARDANMPHVTWSGFNSLYTSARNETPFIQAMISFTILEKLSKDMLDIDVDEFVHGYRYSAPTDKLQNAVEEILDSMVQSVYYGVAQEIDVSESLPEAIKYADYMNSVGYVGHRAYPGEGSREYEKKHLLSRPPVNELVDVRDMVVIDIRGKGKRGFDVKTGTEIGIVTGTENTLSHHLCDELRYNEFTHEFVMKSVPFRYIITDDRSEQNGNKGSSDTDSSSKFDELYSAAMRATNKTQADADKMNFRLREMEGRAASERERRAFREEMRKRADRMSKMRSEYAEDRFRALRHAANERERQAEITRQIRQLTELNRLQNSQESMQEKYMLDSAKRINDMLDKRTDVEYKERVWQRELASKLMDTCSKSSTALNSLLHKVETATGKIQKLVSGGDETFVTEKSFVPTDALDKLSSQLEAAQSLMKSISEATSSMSADLDAGGAEGGPRSKTEHEIKTLVESIDERVNFMLIKNFAQFDEDCKRIERQGEDLYARIERLLKNAEDEPFPNSVKMKYEQDRGYQTFDLSDIVAEFSGDDPVTDAKLVDIVPSMAEEVAEIVQSAGGGSGGSSVVRIADAQIAKLLNSIDKQNKLRMQACRTIASESLVKEKQYTELANKFIKSQVEAEKLQSLYNDAKVLNKLLTQTVQTDTAKLSRELANVTEKLAGLRDELEKSERRADNKAAKFHEALSNTMTELSRVSDKNEEGLDAFQKACRELELDKLLPSAQTSRPSLTEFAAERMDLLEKLYARFSDVKARSEDAFVTKVNALNESIRLSRETRENIGVQPTPSASSSNADNTPRSSTAAAPPDTSHRHQIERELNRVKKENEDNKKAITKALEEVTKRGLKDADDYNRIKAAGWNVANSVKTAVGTTDAEKIHLVNETYCKAELNHAVKKENVEFLRDSLESKWGSHVKSLFPDKVRVTKTGVVVREKSASQTLFQYVFPWLRIRYGDQNVRSTFNFAIQLFKSDMGTFELIRSILVAKRVHFEIRSFILRREEDDGRRFGRQFFTDSELSRTPSFDGSDDGIRRGRSVSEKSGRESEWSAEYDDGPL